MKNSSNWSALNKWVTGAFLTACALVCVGAGLTPAVPLKVHVESMAAEAIEKYEAGDEEGFRLDVHALWRTYPMWRREYTAGLTPTQQAHVEATINDAWFWAATGDPAFVANSYTIMEQQQW